MAGNKGGRPRKYRDEDAQRASRAAKNRRYYAKKTAAVPTQTTTANFEIIHDPHSILAQAEVEGLSQLTDLRHGIQAAGLSVPANADLKVMSCFYVSLNYRPAW